jgi:hypothetical protein
LKYRRISPNICSLFLGWDTNFGCLNKFSRLKLVVLRS